MLEVPKALRFTTKWGNWISSILATSTSRVLGNCWPGESFKHARGLRQGDPLSSLLFILAIDLLQRIIELAAQKGVKLVLPKAASLRCSLYADDVAFFADPTTSELNCLHKILLFFRKCSGLKINISKMELFPRRLENSMVTQLIQNFPRKISKFPGKYLVPPFTQENYARLRCNR